MEAHVSRSLGIQLSDLTSGAVALTSLKPAGPPPPASVLPGEAEEPAFLDTDLIETLDGHAADQNSCALVH